MISLLVLDWYTYMPCLNPLSHHMLCMMTTLVWWITSWMLGFALTLTTFVFPSVCCPYSFSRNHKTVRHWRVPISSFKMTSTWWTSTSTRRSHLFPMVIWFSIRGRIFPKGGEMMRSILWTSPCQESVRRVTCATSTSHTQRWIISFTRAHLTPSRMVYYLTLLPCACIGIVGASTTAGCC